MSSRTPSYTIGVVGVRDFQDALYTNVTYVTRTFEEYLTSRGINRSDMLVVTGGAKGVERMIVDWCKAKDVPCRTIPPNIMEHGREKAFTVRNSRVVSSSDELVVFWDGSIAIISDAIATAMHQQKRTVVFPLI